MLPPDPRTLKLLVRLLRKDAFDDFVEDRRGRLSRLVEVAMEKPVVHVSETADYDEGGE